MTFCVEYLCGGYDMDTSKTIIKDDLDKKFPPRTNLEIPLADLSPIEDLLIATYKEVYDACNDNKIDLELAKKIRANLCRMQQLMHQ
jgi:hypothetical protein